MHTSGHADHTSTSTSPTLREQLVLNRPYSARHNLCCPARHTATIHATRTGGMRCMATVSADANTCTQRPTKRVQKRTRKRQCISGQTRTWMRLVFQAGTTRPKPGARAREKMSGPCTPHRYVAGAPPAGCSIAIP